MRNIEKDKAQAKPEEAKYWTAPYEKSKSTFKDEEERTLTPFPPTLLN